MPTFYRLVASASPTLDDFQSYVALGMPYDDSKPGAREMAEGVSVNGTLTQARARGRAVAALSGLRYVAELSVPEAGAIRFRRTGRQRGHHTLWAEPAALLACVVSVVPVDEADVQDDEDIQDNRG